MAEDKKDGREEENVSRDDAENGHGDREKRVAEKLKAAVKKDQEGESDESYDPGEDGPDSENDCEAEADYWEEDDDEDSDFEVDDTDADQKFSGQVIDAGGDDDAAEDNDSENDIEAEADYAEEDDDYPEDDDREDRKAELAAAKAAKKKKKDKKDKKSKKSAKKSKSEDGAKNPKATDGSVESKKKADRAAKEKVDLEPVHEDPVEGEVVGGVFTPNKPYRPPAELDVSERFVDPTRVAGKWWFLALIVIAIVCVVGVFLYADKPEDVQDVLTGQYKLKKILERDRIEEQNRLEELKKQNKFGMLVITGYPDYATIKFNGQKRYGITPSGQWRALILKGNVTIKNMNIKDPLKIEVENPGFTPITEDLKEGSWVKNPTGEDYSKLIGATLAPVSEAHKMEFEQRLSQDSDNDFFGTITINSTPPGAFVQIDGHRLRNAEGKELLTPVTASANYVFDEKTKKYEEVKFRVDTVLDIGHKIEVGFDYPNACKEGQTECVNDDGCCPSGPKCNVATDTDCKAPTLVESLQRQNWTCTFDKEKIEKAIEDIKEGKAKSRAVLQDACVYTFTLNADLDGIKKFARAQEAERLRVERLNAELTGLEEGGDATAGEGSGEAGGDGSGTANPPA